MYLGLGLGYEVGLEYHSTPVKVSSQTQPHAAPALNVSANLGYTTLMPSELWCLIVCNLREVTITFSVKSFNSPKHEGRPLQPVTEDMQYGLWEAVRSHEGTTCFYRWSCDDHRPPYCDSAGILDHNRSKMFPHSPNLTHNHQT